MSFSLNLFDVYQAKLNGKIRQVWRCMIVKDYESKNCPRLQMVSLPFSLFSCSWVALCCAACDVLKG